MSSIQTIVASLLGVPPLPEEDTRAKSRRAPECEALEGRQLLNGSWGRTGTHGVWSGMAGGLGLSHVGPDAAHIQQWNGAGGFDKGNLHNFAFGGKGGLGHGMPALSTQAK